MNGAAIAGLPSEPRPPFRASEFRIRRATLPFERAGHFARRRDAFCVEQTLFPASDRDAVDDVAIPVVAVACLLGDADAVVGAVRLHEEAPGLWWGARLCVARDIRGAAGVGTALIRFAVSTAAASGATRFLAHVQARNVPLFEALGWRVLDRAARHGHPHARMEADLSRYPPLDRAELVVLAPAPDARAA